MQPLKPWMYYLLRFAGSYNLLAGLSMIVFYHEGFKLLGLKKPELLLPLQLVGMMVGLFGVGYHLVASAPLENRNVLLLGFWSKALGSALGVYYVFDGKLPPVFLAVLFFADIIYLAPFWAILRHLDRQRAQHAQPTAAVPRRVEQNCGGRAA